MDALFGEYLRKHGLFTMGVLAVLAAGLFIFLPTGDDNSSLSGATAQATITNQEAVNYLLDENAALRLQVDKLITQACYLEALTNSMYATFTNNSSYAGFDQDACQKNLRKIQIPSPEVKP